MNSNWTGRWDRTTREAFGHSVEFEDRHVGDKWVFIVAVFAAGFLLGMAVFGG